MSRWQTLHGVLLSLPGSPFLYYGDELGMGDEYLLRDRDGVRTPMQWTTEPGAGFSDADPGRFYLPVVTDPAYAPAVVNVEAQRDDPDSLLHWVRALLAAWRELSVFGTGSFSLVDTGDSAVLGYRRTDDEADITVLANFATTPRTVGLSVPMVDARTGRSFLESVTLRGHGFHWLSVSD